MVNKGRLSRYIVILACWILSIFIVLILTTKNHFKNYDHLFADILEENRAFESALPKNELGEFSFIRFDSTRQNRPVYGIAFEKLLLTNNNFGPFKTAMHKKAIIRDLHMRYYNNDSPKKFADASIFGVEELIKQTGDILKSSKKYNVGNFNFINVSEVYADRFDCKFFSEDTLLLSVNCRKAMASYGNSNIELRGHVTIKTKDGITLESNYVEWDVRNNIFNVRGLYSLNRNGAVKTGRNACFDFTLNEVSTRQAKNYVKEEHKCIAGL